MRRRTAAWLALVLAAAACGKKGPPLAPIVRVPAAVEGVTARRVGETVYLAVPAPATNIDGSMPADVTRIEIYGATATAAPPRARFLEIATLVGTVHPPAPPEPGTAPAAPPATGPVVLALRERLTPDALQPRTLPSPPNPRPQPTAPVPQSQAGVTPPRPPQRFYLAIPFNARGRPGPAANPIALPLSPLAEPPGAVRLSYSETTMFVEWEPSGGILGFLMDRALPIETLDDMPPAAAPTPTLYNVYRELAPDPLVLPPPRVVVTPDAAARSAAASGSTAAAESGPPAPVNGAPLDALGFSDGVEFDRERCYEIRAVRGAGPETAEGLPSARACLTPVDVFPPPVPAGLSVVAAEGAISLIWEPNTDADTAGYLVLRGSGAGATLQPITPSPVVEARFTDRAVAPGERYTYAVVAVDARVPVPNASAESPRVEETAR